MRIQDNTISGKIAKEVFEAMWASGKGADAIIEEKGLRQITDTSAIEKAIDEVMAKNPGQLADYRSGKDKLFGFFVGPGDEGHGRQGQSGAAQRAAEEEARAVALGGLRGRSGSARLAPAAASSGWLSIAPGSPILPGMNSINTDDQRRTRSGAAIYPRKSAGSRLLGGSGKRLAGAARAPALHPAVQNLLGEAVSASVLLAATLKFEGTLTLQLEGKGDVRLLVAQCSNDFKVRAVARLERGGGRSWRPRASVSG